MKRHLKIQVVYEKALKKMLGKPRYIQGDQIPPQNLWQECSLDGLQEKVLVQ